ncbi:fibronectin type III domain-containing protein [Rhizomonospora bruguierae]|uniref:fibronectin type III domain-containing protein n=1 Tax=Rhizomonospora bruguierae TaxID=1581705 RepID=UPI0020BE86DA|nr:fibronectin type III domain-containing protein [Micromonospora sp. NBRC 107566]
MDTSAVNVEENGAGKPPATRRRGRGWLVTAAVVASLVAAMGLTALGIGTADHAMANYDAAAWLWSSARGEVARVNGTTGRVDTRLKVAGAQAHAMQVTQTDQFLLLRDLNTGQVSALDPATLQITATSSTTPGIGVSVALHDEAAFVIDAVQGIVRQLDPRSLQPIGEPIRYPPGIAGGTFDGEGRLWIALPGEGTVSAVTAAPLPPTDGSGGVGGSLSPRQVRTHAVAPPSHDLALSALDDGVAVLDRTVNVLTTVRGDRQVPVTLPLTSPGTLPNRTNGAEVPVTVVDNRHVYVVQGDQVHDFRVPGDGPQLRPAVAWAGRFYCPDDATGTVYVLDPSGKLVETISVKGANGPLELEVRENHLFINAPNSATARVVDEKHHVKTVDKYANDILGGDPPPVPPPPPPPSKPQVGPPGAPRSVTAAAGNAQARVSWRPAAENGSPISKYVVEGAGKTWDVGADQRSLDVTELTNGETYRFTVHAVNAKGAGPKRTSNPVVPTSEVPDAPTSVTAVANKDGTVTVSWPAANGQGHKISKYAVTAVSAGASAPVGEATGTELITRKGDLEYGSQYAFTVVAINDIGAGSESSPISESVVPFTVPEAPAGLDATTVADKQGAVRVAWSPPAENGRPITKYVVTAGGKSQDVTGGTSVELSGLGDGQNVQVTVRAVNEAGESAPATATARTVAPPVINQVSVSATDYTSVTLALTVDAGRGTTTCSVSGFGGATVTGGCTSIRVTGLLASTSYTFTVTASNAAGNATTSKAQATKTLQGTAYCYTSSTDPAQAAWCNDQRNALELQSDPKQLYSGQVGKTNHGQKYDAVCRYDGGDEVYAYIYNHEKRSTTWIKIKANNGQYYTPWAWFNLDGGDDPGALPKC